MLKLSTLINSEGSLKKLLAVKLPVKIAYKLSKIVNLIQPELTIFQEQRDKLIKELGTEKDKDSGNFQVTPENMPKFIEEIGKLTDIEVNLEFGAGKAVEPIKLADLGDIELEAQDLVALDWLITE